VEPKRGIRFFMFCFSRKKSEALGIRGADVIRPEKEKEVVRDEEQRVFVERRPYQMC